MLISSKPLRALVVTLAAMLPAPLFAQAYPVKPIRMILPFPPGGPTDILGRMIAQKLTEQMGQPVIADNRPGATGNIGLELAAKSPPDGYTMVLSAPPLVISPSLYPKLNYKQSDLAPVSLVAAIQNIIVTHNSVPARSLKELIALARSHPGKLNFSSSGAGSTNHLACELLRGRYKLDMVHVPYKGAAPALIALMSGQVDWGTMAVPPAIPHVQANRVRGLAVLSEQRIAAIPQVPTSKEAGVDDFVVPIWYGILVPAGTPREIIGRLNSELRKGLTGPDMREKLAAAGVDPMTNTPEQFASFIGAETVRYAKVIREANIKIE
jgi:tripartite-type tricarboxylate transporter receptor subunit TctC